MSTFWLLVVMPIGYGACLFATQTRHTVYIRTPHDFRSTLFSIVNNNDNKNQHTIMQMNNNSMHTECMPALPSASAQKPPVLSWVDYYKEHSYKALVGAAALGVGSIGGMYWWAKYTITNDQAWSCWMQEYSLDALLQFPPEQLALQLFTEIKKRYSRDDTTMLNFLDPLVAFMKAYDKEVWVLLWLESIRVQCSQLPIVCWLPGNKRALEDIRTNIKRLRFLKQLLVSELSNYTWDDQRLAAGSF